MERKDLLIMSILTMGNELDKKEEDLNSRLDKYILENKIIVDKHLRLYYQEDRGRVLSMLVLHELTNEVIILDAPRPGDINPNLHIKSLTDQLKEKLKSDGWMSDDDLNNAYCSIKQKIG